jgi:hypothetical protein
MPEANYALRRITPRVPFFADAEIILRDGTSVPAQLSEISARGCYVDALEPLPVGTELHLAICDLLTTCELDGKVIYEHSGGGLGVVGMGVLFGNLGPEQHSTIDAWLNQLANGNRGNASPEIPEAQKPA